jgi:hypothetical protein
MRGFFSEIACPYYPWDLLFVNFKGEFYIFCAKIGKIF